MSPGVIFISSFEILHHFFYLIAFISDIIIIKQQSLEG